MKKILFVILHTCKRPERYSDVINTWGKDIDYLFYSDCDDESKKIVKVSDDSTYSSNEPKHVNVIKHLIEKNYQYDWFFFCDDDTFVNTKKVLENIELFDKDKINGSVIKGTWGSDRTLEYCSGGAGYVIHKDLLEVISPTIKSGDSGYSDVTLGLCARNLGIENKNFVEFNSRDPKFYNLEINSINEMFTFHYIKGQSMIEMYQTLN